MQTAAEAQRIVTAQPSKSVLTLSDLTGAQFSRDAVTRMKEVAVFDTPYVKRAALVAAESLPKVFYEALKAFSRREFPRFKTRAGSDGLVSQGRSVRSSICPHLSVTSSRCLKRSSSEWMKYGRITTHGNGDACIPPDE